MKNFYEAILEFDKFFEDSLFTEKTVSKKLIYSLDLLIEMSKQMEYQIQKSPTIINIHYYSLFMDVLISILANKFKMINFSLLIKERSFLFISAIQKQQNN